MEIILSNLMKCSVVTKKLISTKVMEVTIVFLSNTPFYPKMITMLCNSMKEKNVQLRQLCCTYIQTILKTHGSQESVRAIVEKSDTSFSIDNFLKKELVDASPTVRDACRSLYWTYSQYWPEKAKRVYDMLDLPTQKALGRSKPMECISSATSSTRLVKTPLLKRSASERSSVSKNTSVPLSSRAVPVKRSPSFPGPGSSSFSGLSSLPSYARPVAPKSTLIRSISSPVAPKRVPTLSKQLKQKPAATATTLKTTAATTAVKTTTAAKSLPITAAKVTATTTTTSSTTATTLTATSTTLNKSLLSHRPSLSQRKEDLEAMSLLSMLKDNSSHIKSKGIRLLAERIKDVPYEPTLTTTLPSNVPKKIDILPLLMDLLSRKEFDSEIHQTLMCWECITSIFTNIFSLRHYGPTLIIADQQQRQYPNSDKRMKVWKTYSKGLRRLKMFLKRNDTLLAERLLSILTSVKSTEQKLLDASIKHDLRLNPSHQGSLEVGLLKWMNELLHDYIGLPEDEDEELLVEGSDWLDNSDGIIAEQWFDTSAHMKSYVSFVVDMLFETNENDEKYPLLCCMIRNLKLANQKVFERELDQLDRKQKIMIEDALIVDSRSLSRDDEYSVLFEAEYSVPCEAENIPPASSCKRKMPSSVDADVDEPRQKMTKINGDAVNTVSPVQSIAIESPKRKADSLAQESALYNKRRKSCS
ncbi:clasp N terminal-domain-containing protein [Thamnidium elegans]|nr:clasp N terminal-domain-containing protein [Thamnidium elegans]